MQVALKNKFPKDIKTDETVAMVAAKRVSYFITCETGFLACTFISLVVEQISTIIQLLVNFLHCFRQKLSFTVFYI